MEPEDGLKVINASLYRMGTKSMSEAYKILGYRPHHGLDDPLGIPWHQIEEAAEGKWPNAPGARRRKPYTRSDWDAVWSAYDVVTDIASPFAVDLAKAYPDAKVVVVQRDFDTWWPSFQSENLAWRFFPGVDLIIPFFNLIGMRSGPAQGKTFFGMFHAQTVGAIHANARSTYDCYFAEIRQAVPAERRLEYKLGSGWEPLCEFLGKEVPDVPFPRVNDRQQHKAEADAIFRQAIAAIASKVLPWVIALAAIVIGMLYLLPRQEEYMQDES